MLTQEPGHLGAERVNSGVRGVDVDGPGESAGNLRDACAGGKGEEAGGRSQTHRDSPGTMLMDRRSRTGHPGHLDTEPHAVMKARQGGGGGHGEH